jgi:hypothetical protein
MRGQDTAGVPSIQFERGGQLTIRLQAIKEAKDEYWDSVGKRSVFYFKSRANGLKQKEMIY